MSLRRRYYSNLLNVYTNISVIHLYSYYRYSSNISVVIDTLQPSSFHTNAILKPNHPASIQLLSQCHTAESSLAPSLLCLDLPITLGSNAEDPLSIPQQGRGGSGPRGGGPSPSRLSPLGASILICVLGYGQGACRQFTDR